MKGKTKIFRLMLMIFFILAGCGTCGNINGDPRTENKWSKDKWRFPQIESGTPFKSPQKETKIRVKPDEDLGVKHLQLSLDKDGPWEQSQCRFLLIQSLLVLILVRHCCLQCAARLFALLDTEKPNAANQLWKTLALALTLSAEPVEAEKLSRLQEKERRKRSNDEISRLKDTQRKEVEEIRDETCQRKELEEIRDETCQKKELEEIRDETCQKKELEEIRDETCQKKEGEEIRDETSQRKEEEEIRDEICQFQEIRGKTKNEINDYIIWKERRKNEKNIEPGIEISLSQERCRKRQNKDRPWYLEQSHFVPEKTNICVQSIFGASPSYLQRLTSFRNLKSCVSFIQLAKAGFSFSDGAVRCDGCRSVLDLENVTSHPADPQYHNTPNCPFAQEDKPSPFFNPSPLVPPSEENDAQQSSEDSKSLLDGKHEGKGENEKHFHSVPNSKGSASFSEPSGFIQARSTSSFDSGVDSCYDDPGRNSSQRHEQASDQRPTASTSSKAPQSQRPTQPSLPSQSDTVPDKQTQQPQSLTRSQQRSETSSTTSTKQSQEQPVSSNPLNTSSRPNKQPTQQAPPSSPAPNNTGASRTNTAASQTQQNSKTSTASSSTAGTNQQRASVSSQQNSQTRTAATSSSETSQRASHQNSNPRTASTSSAETQRQQASGTSQQNSNTRTASTSSSTTCQQASTSSQQNSKPRTASTSSAETKRQQASGTSQQNSNTRTASTSSSATSQQASTSSQQNSKPRTASSSAETSRQPASVTSQQPTNTRAASSSSLRPAECPPSQPVVSATQRRQSSSLSTSSSTSTGSATNDSRRKSSAIKSMKRTFLAVSAITKFKRSASHSESGPGIEDASSGATGGACALPGGDKGQELDITDYFDEEVSLLGNKKEAKTIKQVPCKKNKGHYSYFPMHSLQMTQLHPKLRSNGNGSLVFLWALANLTVRIIVKTPKSEKEQRKEKEGPESEKKYRVGSGMVLLDDPGEGIETFSPSRAVLDKLWQQEPGKTRSKQAIYIQTSSHVVKTDKEAAHTMVELFFDSPDRSKVVSIKGSSVVHSGQPGDKHAILVCKVSDKTLLNKISQLKSSFWDAERKLPEHVKSELTDKVLLVSHPHGCAAAVSYGDSCVNKYSIKRNGEGEPPRLHKERRVLPQGFNDTLFKSLIYTADTCEGCSGAPVVAYTKEGQSSGNKVSYKISMWMHNGNETKQRLSASALKICTAEDLEEFKKPLPQAKKEVKEPVVQTPNVVANPLFVKYSARLASFENAGGVQLIHTPELFAFAGFYYADYGDCVRCFYCGIGLRKWKEGDNVFKEHNRHRDSCLFLDTQFSLYGEESLTSGESDVFQKFGPKVPDANEEVNMLKTEHSHLNHNFLCKICYHQPSKDLFLPCSHLCSCGHCCKLMSHCPICDAKIEATVETFFG